MEPYKLLIYFLIGFGISILFVWTRKRKRK